MNEGGFTEHDISLLYTEAVGMEYPVKVIRRYRVTNGYMALTYLQGEYRVFFASSNIIGGEECYVQFRRLSIGHGIRETGAIQAIEDIAEILGAEIWGN